MGDYVTSFFIIYGAIAIRYLIIATIFFLIYYKFLRNKIAYKKIQQKFPKGSDYIRELKYSLLSVVFFGAFGVLALRSPISIYNQVYYDLNSLPIWYYMLCFPVMLIIHDTYFYWMHRSLHHPRIFKHAHLVHHKSTNPSPWAAYAFHPLEAILEAAILPILAFMLPLHITAIGLFFLFSIIYNVYGHSGFELYPKKFQKHWLGKWLNTSVHHNLHHKNFDNSYGLYFTFWDRLMNTMAESYEETYDEVKGRKKLSIN